MKKTILAGALSLLFLAGCVGQNAGSSALSSGSGTEGSSSSSSETKESKTEKVYDRIHEIVYGGNFTLSYKFGTSASSQTLVSDVYTLDYFLYGYEQEGQIILDSYDSRIGKEFAYNFALVNDEVQVKNMVVTYAESVPNPVSVLAGSNILASLFVTGTSFGLASLYEDVTGVATTDPTAIYAFGTTMRLSLDSEALPFSELHFDLKEDGSLAYTLKGASSSVTGEFTAIGSSKVELLDTYLKTENIGLRNALSKEDLSTLRTETVSIDSSVKRHTSEKPAGYDYFATEVDELYVANDNPELTKMAYKIRIKNATGENYFQYFERAKDGKANLSYIDGQNVAHTSYTEPDVTSNIQFGSDIGLLQSPYLFDPLAFRKVTESRYQYVGYEGKNILKAALLATDLGEIETMYLNLDSEGKAISFDIQTVPQTEQGSKGPIYYTIHGDIKDPRPLAYLSNNTYSTADADLESAFTATKTLASPFKLLSYRSDAPAKKNEILYADDTLLTIKDGVYTGYKMTAKGLVYFTAEKNAAGDQYIASPVSVNENDTLAAHLPFNLSPNVFKKNADGTYALNEYVKIKAPKDLLFFGDNLSTIQNETLKVSLANGKLGTISYQSSDSSGALLPEQKIEFSHEGIALPSNLDLSALESAETDTHSWEKSESADLWSGFLKTVGANASHLPYLFDSALAGKWEGEESSLSYLDPAKPVLSDGTSNPFYCLSNFEDPSDANYYASYASLLVSKGFSKDLFVTGSGRKYDVYLSESIGLKVLLRQGGDLTDGIYVASLAKVA